MKKKTNWAKTKRYLPLYLMLLPGAAYLIINNYLPMAGLVLAFKKVNYNVGLFQSPWTGLSNFKYLLMGIITAVALDSIRKKFFKRFSQVIILIPYLLSTVIISYIVYAFLSGNNGFMNMTVLPALHLDKISWYNDAKYWPVIITIVYLWMSFGYSSILYYSTLIGIDKSYYEAAVVDGAGILDQIRFITLPALKTTIITLVLMAVGRICYSDFGLFYQVPMNSGLLYSTTQTIDTYVYRGLLELNDIGRSTAAGFLQSILGFICIFIANIIVSKIDKDSALF